MEEATLAIEPSRLIHLIFPNPSPSDPTTNPYADFLRIAVLDSPTPDSHPPQIAALLVPKNRHSDWLFSTPQGHLQLLLSLPSLSRLFLIGDPLSDPSPPPTPFAISDSPPPKPSFQAKLLPFLFSLSQRRDLSDIPFLEYEDGVVRSLPVATHIGPVAGEMLVEDAEVAVRPGGSTELRRRLRFKRLPNLIQTQMRLVVSGGRAPAPDVGVLVQPYLAPMVAALSLARTRLRARVLCLGVGGGALLSFLRSRLGFDVLGVEGDETVVAVAKEHFGLVEDELLRVRVGDAVEFVKETRERFDAIMVDLDPGKVGFGFGTPPAGFAAAHVLEAVKLALRARGVLVVNAVRTEQSVFDRFVARVRDVFPVLHGIDVAEEENYVLVASAVGAGEGGGGSSFGEELRRVIGGYYLDRIERI
ncbi:hypothetical protein QJS04_geneDACA008399 [Acorus gramineus]|uniref:Uncharacterized protein n=1 Tax=Acorus gramineus TaxID=55184 RepID=A0AAV9AHK9_ACOGR|nr:hypothetical protein QJS04_geneDACA008399 [Acorus gramineus]